MTSTMRWETLLSTQRYGHEPMEAHELGRSHFHKDHDRIVFSPAFRRLAGKTQVHPLAMNDHVHTRLIHSVEVGSVGRSLGLKVGERIHGQLPPWIQPDDFGVIVQAACLAHDIGNPPFGHAGEYAIQDWFRQREDSDLLAPLAEKERQDLMHWEGNAQGFRLVTQIEYHLFRGGLRLSYPTLASMLKYPWTATGAGARGKFSCFQSELPHLREMADALALSPQGPDRWARHPLSYLMEAADDICYAIIDLEDAVDLHILPYEEVRDLLLRFAPQAELALDADDTVSAQRKLAALRGKAMQTIIDAVVTVFLTHQKTILAGQLEGDLLDHTPPGIGRGIAGAKALARRKVFNDTHKTETEIGAYSTLSALLEAFITAGFELHRHGHSGLSFKSRRVLDLMRDEAPAEHWPLYAIYLRLLDFITQQTDQHAGYLARQIGGPSVRV